MENPPGRPEWQPIDTAPQGVAILGCLMDGDHYEYIERLIVYDEGRKVFNLNSGNYMAPRAYPTHWMPEPLLP